VQSIAIIIAIIYYYYSHRFFLLYTFLFRSVWSVATGVWGTANANADDTDTDTILKFIQ